MATTAKRRGNHEGTVPRQRADGRWVVQLRYVDDLGVPQRAEIYGRTAAEVRGNAKAMRARLEGGLPARDSTMTLGAFSEEWIGTALAASERKESTRTMYAAITRRHIIGRRIGTTPIGALRPRHVEGWLADLKAEGLSESTCRNGYAILRAILDTAVRDQALGRNPALAVKRPRVAHHEARFLTPDELRTLLDAADGSRYAPLFLLLAHTGLRRGEALALRWPDVDLDKGTLRVRGTLTRLPGGLTVTEPKTARSRRTVPLSPTVARVLKGVRQAQREDRLRAGSMWRDSGHIFATEFGEPCDPRNALRALTVAAHRVGLEGVGLHTLRHSAASVMITRGVPLKVVSDILGHGSIAITADIYGHVSPDISREALAGLSEALDG